MDTNNFKNKNVLVMGLGRFGGGADSASFASKAGAKVTVTDLASAEKLRESIDSLSKLPNIEFHLGYHKESDFKQADIVIANPAVPPENDFLEIARQNGAMVTSQINIFFQLCPAPIIGITGANGKSTTTALTAHILENSKHAATKNKYNQVWLSGNIGNRPLLDLIDKITPHDLVVLEISSFQLDQLTQINKAPNIALLTNVTPNHLDRYKTFENYCASKENIFKCQKLQKHSPAVSIFNAEDSIASELFDKYKDQPGRICLKYSADNVDLQLRRVYPLPGRANLSNLAAALAIAGQFGIEQSRIKNSLANFKTLPHRLELVTRKKGVSWFNDSIATTPQSAIAALEAFEEPRIIIAGGYDKDLPFDELGQKIAQHTKAAILLGQTASKIAQAIQQHNPKGKIPDVHIVNSLTEAVELADRIAISGDVVLLSPACASYDMFDNFQQRGNEFARLVNQVTR